jgi:hypothetical protein
VDSSAGGTASSSATAVEGSSPSQDRSVDFLQSTQIGCQSSSTTTPSTTREDLALTSLTGLSSRSGRRGCWQCLPVQPRWAPPLAPLRPLPLLQQRQPVQRPPALLRPPLLQQQRMRAPCSLEEQGAGAPTAQELFNSGGWATTPSGFPHRVPLAFVALISGLRRRHLLHARKLSHQEVNSRN